MRTKQDRKQETRRVPERSSRNGHSVPSHGAWRKAVPKLHPETRAKCSKTTVFCSYACVKCVDETLWRLKQRQEPRKPHPKTCEIVGIVQLSTPRGLIRCSVWRAGEMWNRPKLSKNQIIPPLSPHIVRNGDYVNFDDRLCRDVGMRRYRRRGGN